MAKRKLTRADAAALYEKLSASRPAPKTELHYSNPFTLLVAVVLSAQATDEGVNRATKVLFEKADTPAKMLALGEAELAQHIKTIGLWRNKTKNVLALSKILVDDFDGKVPEDRDALESLPGVGRKTANVVMNVAFGAPTIAVDTHIFRIGNRTGLARGKTPLDVEKGLEKITPPEYLTDAHHWLILHGRYVCTARKAPDCPNCVINEICLYKDKTPAPGDGKPESKKGGNRKMKAVKSAPAKRASAKTPGRRAAS